jgi:hypothetical protein
MKFVRRYRGLHGGCSLEYNDDGLAILFEFLESDTYKSIQYYIDWLKNPHKSDSIGGNLTTLEREGELITIIDIHDRFFNDDSPSEEKEQDKYVTDRQRLIQILHQWEEFVAERDKLSSSIRSSKDLLITQDKEEVFSVGLIDQEDPRFSYCIVDGNPKYARIEKSEIFDDYFKVISNDKGLYNLGSILAEYSKKRFKPILSWMQRDYPYDDDDDKIVNYFESTHLSKDRQGLFLITVWNREKKTRDEVVRFSSEELKSLLNSWLELVDKDPFPQAVCIVKENNEIFFRPEY